MTIPRFSSLLIMLALGHEASAVQMGQISSESVRGQPLLARVTLYGPATVAAHDLQAELLPAFGADTDTLALFDVHARIETNEYGEQALVITSARAFDATSLSLRVRLRDGIHAVVRHFELTIPAAPAPRLTAATATVRKAPARRAPRATLAGNEASAPATLTALTNEYGPVRAGQSLWGILQETGLAGTGSQQLMKDIVAANPQAFVGGDATRLRVGVTLRLPEGRSVAKAAPRATAARDGKQAIDADTAARLERLATQFAEIRARYAAQQRQSATSSASSQPTLAAPQLKSNPTVAVADKTSANPHAAEAVAPAKAVSKIAKPAPKVNAPAPSAKAESLLDTLARNVDGKILLGIGAVLLAAALLLGGLRIGRRLRNRLSDAGVRSADRELVAEIARKTEKRAQLEDEVKRMIAGRRDTGSEPVPGMLRPADILSGPRASLDEIETRIAHGQYNEAEAMLEQTIADAPNNHRAKLRLAEIYYLNERHEEFVDLADEIHRQHRRDIGDCPNHYISLYFVQTLKANVIRGRYM